MDFKLLSARAKMQGEAKDAFRKSNYNGAAIISVGGGKAKILIDLALELIEKYNIRRILYLCDNRRLRDSYKDGFPEQLQKWGSDLLIRRTQLECYQTAYKWVNQKYDLILSDEVDFALTPKYSNVFFNISASYRILVSGTLAQSKKKLLKEIAPIIYKCSMKDAEDRGIVNKSKYYIYNYKMSDDESKEYIRLTRKIAMAMAEDNAKATRFWVSQRKEFLVNLNSSYLNCRKLMKWLWDSNKQTRLIIFCQRTEQADRICNYSYHGKNERDDNLTRFQEGEISALSVVSKIKRGINVVNVNTGIFESLDGSTTEFEQRGGRLKRLPISQLASVIFMNPWFKTTDSKGKLIFKTTIVNEWIGRATGNLSSTKLIDLKL